MRAAARVLAAPALMALIWVLSSQSDPGPDLGGAQEVAAIVAHFVLYGALWVCFAWALRFERPLLAFVLTVGYGVVDEVHQTFVPGRDGTPFDVAVDAAGAAAAWAATRWRRGATA